MPPRAATNAMDANLALPKSLDHTLEPLLVSDANVYVKYPMYAVNISFDCAFAAVTFEPLDHLLDKDEKSDLGKLNLLDAIPLPPPCRYMLRRIL